MTTKIKNAIENYQCPGCVCGSDITCFEKSSTNQGCGKHLAGTTILGIGPIFLGLPTGFNRLGIFKELKPRIFEEFTDEYNKYNIPVWKHLDDLGNTIVRGIMPRKNEPFLDIFLENCLDKIDCIEISKQDVDYMD